MTGFSTGMVALAVTCPYCHARHSYVFDAEMLLECLDQPLEAPCGWGQYRVSIMFALSNYDEG